MVRDARASDFSNAAGRRHSFGAVTNTPSVADMQGRSFGQLICTPVELAALCGSLRAVRHMCYIRLPPAS